SIVAPLAKNFVQGVLSSQRNTIEEKPQPAARAHLNNGVHMRIGIPKEVKNNENRVAITEPGVFELNRRGHEVFVQAGAGLGSAITDEQYREAGATIVDAAEDVWNSADLILKVKEPIESEYSL